MQQSHGIGYVEYSNKLQKRIKVEKEREESYEKSLKVVDEVNRVLHR
ncbi:hypothetical protein [Gracilibacillus oryzae]|nr:hypothetical protein [Gracilibacillus oryzae]